MNDRGMVAAMKASDPRGLAEAYDTYASRLYGYCRSVLRSPDAAADALQDTFVLANERIGQLRNPDRFRPWLYAIARNECLHQLRGDRRTTGIEQAGEVRDETVDLDADLRKDELRHLVQDAFEGLNTRDREVLELATRQDLEGAELAATLGLSLNHTHALLSRARQQLENALAAVIVARNGRRDCPELGQMLEAWDGTMTVLMRKRINRHIGDCEICAERKHHDVSAAALLTLLPVPVLSPTVRDQVMEVVTGPEHAEYRNKVRERSSRFDQNGFPVPRDQWVRRLSPTRAKIAAAGLAGVAVLASGPLLWAGEGPGQPEHRPTTPQITRIEPGETVPPGVKLEPGDVVNGRTLGPGETYGPGDRVPKEAPGQRPNGDPRDGPSDGSSSSGNPDKPGGQDQDGGNPPPGDRSDDSPSTGDGVDGQLQDPGLGGQQDPGLGGQQDPGLGGHQDPGTGGQQDPGLGGHQDPDPVDPPDRDVPSYNGPVQRVPSCDPVEPDC